MSEIELKFGVRDAAGAAVDGALRRLGARSQTIESRYWDSADGRLAAARIALRTRKAAGRWEQTVKAPGRNAAERLEETVPRPGAWGSEGPPPLPSLHAGTRAGELLRAALTQTHGLPARLQAVHTTLVRRRALEIESAGSAIEVAFDRGAIHAGDRSMPVCEVELELKRGDVAALIALGRANVDAHSMWLSTIAKSSRGERLARGPAATPRAVKAKAPALRGAATGAAVFHAVIASCLEQVLANASVVAAGEPDDDVVHQLRIGLRRMRTAARELAPWRGALDPRWEAPASAVFRALGTYRDRQTVAAAMQQRLATAGSPDPALRPLAQEAPIDPVAVVRAAAFQHALLDVLGYVMQAAPLALAPADGPAANPRPERAIGARLDKLHARLRRDAKRFDDLDELERHRVRKRLKRLRYLAELVGPLYRGRRVARFLRALEPAQDELGHYMDIVVALQLAHTAAGQGDARAWFNVGWLKAQLPDAIAGCTKALGRVAEARPFWSERAR